MFLCYNIHDPIMLLMMSVRSLVNQRSIQGQYTAIELLQGLLITLLCTNIQLLNTR